MAAEKSAAILFLSKVHGRACTVWQDKYMTIALELLAGSFIGAVLGFVGAGGAMLSVPILIYIFDIAPHRATVAALAIVFAAAVSGVIPKVRKREVLYKDAAVIWAIGSLSNIWLANIAEHLSERFITTGFALVLIIAGSTMLFPPRYAEMKRMSWPTLVVISLIIGSMTGLFGIGGGFLAIPVLVLAFNTPQAMAAGTSLLIIALNTMTALLAHYKVWSDVEWGTPLIIALAAVVVALWSSHHSSRAHPVLLRKSFAFLLYAIALFTLLKTWFI